MIRWLSLVRYILLVPVAVPLPERSFGSALGAVKMWDGLIDLFAAAEETGTTNATIIDVMSAIDAFLFAIVLVIFALSVAFGLILKVDDTSQRMLPAWVQVADVADIKRILLEVILVYLVVDFVTDLSESDVSLSWRMLIKPLAVIMLGAVLRLQSSSLISTQRQS